MTTVNEPTFPRLYSRQQSTQTCSLEDLKNYLTILHINNIYFYSYYMFLLQVHLIKFINHFPAYSQTFINTQPWPINIWSIKDPTIKGFGYRHLCGLTHNAEDALTTEGSHTLSSPNLEHWQGQFWSWWWKLLVSSVPAPTPWNKYPDI